MRYDKNKILIFSFDDGVTQDERMIEILNKYGIKGTFNLNSELLGNKNEIVREGVLISHNKIKSEDVRRIYRGHEIAAHTLTHPTLTMVDDDAEIARQVEQDRKNLSELAGYEVTSFAYPGGGINNDARVAKLIKRHTGVKNARTTTATHSFAPPRSIYRLDPTVSLYEEPELTFKLADKFVNMVTLKPKIFFVWGHSYEFDIHGTWGELERLCAMLGGRDDICYTTASALNNED